jgi:formate C-acetyltransferase
MVLDVKFAPGFFAELRRQGVFRPFVEAYFRSGGMEIQFNVIDRATLLDAQRFPARHRDLVVRVSGFSAYFVDLARVVQNEIIARTEHVTL